MASAKKLLVGFVVHDVQNLDMIVADLQKCSIFRSHVQGIDVSIFRSPHFSETMFELQGEDVSLYDLQGTLH